MVIRLPKLMRPSRNKGIRSEGEGCPRVQKKPLGNDKARNKAAERKKAENEGTFNLFIKKIKKLVNKREDSTKENIEKVEEEIQALQNKFFKAVDGAGDDRENPNLRICKDFPKRHIYQHVNNKPVQEDKPDLPQQHYLQETPFETVDEPQKKFKKNPC